MSFRGRGGSRGGGFGRGGGGFGRGWYMNHIAISVEPRELAKKIVL